MHCNWSSRIMACPVKTDDIGDRRLVEQNNHKCFEQKEVGNEVVGEGQGLVSSEEDESRLNAVAENVNVLPGGEIQVHSELKLIPQQQPQVPTVCWERFLPVRSLKVLLVENDDSTRHVVSALLRNCSYEVTAVSNGFHAWKILEELSNHIDIIITEVAMPFISGIALLCKIRSHKTFKNIPVVMMSSHDSMGIVFKCLSNGAVDFLVKPIRKNELKNLWQHVWRRCHSSSGSGSESGTQSRKSVKLRSVEVSDNHTASSDEQDDRSNGSNIRNGSDSDSGTQSSWTKRPAEVDSPEPDSTCAQVIHMKPEAIGHQQVHATETKECQEHDQQLDVDTRVSGLSKLQLEYKHAKLSVQPTTKRQNVSPEVDSKPIDGLMEKNNELLSVKLRALDHNSINPQIESRTFDGPSGLSNISKLKDKVKYDSGQLSSPELRLRRLKGVEGTGNTEHDDLTVLRHSDLSAFSKYDTASSSNQGPMGNVGSCSPVDNSPTAVKTETMQNFPLQSNSNQPIIQQSNGSSNNNDMASTTCVNLKEEALNEKSESVSAFKCFDSSTCQAMQNSCIRPPQQPPPGKEDVKVDTKQVQVQHHHHYYHHFHHHVNDTNQHQQDRDDETSLKSMAVTAPQCGSSNAFEGPIKGDTGNISLNRSTSGSNHGSNGQNGDSAALNAEPLNVESDNVAAGNSGDDGGGISGRIGEDTVDEDRVAQREAALYKFCQKRKERSSEKKVQYHSRKRPAGQPPHIGGQFVRQIASHSNSSKDNQSHDHVSEANSDDSIR